MSCLTGICARTTYPVRLCLANDSGYGISNLYVRIIRRTVFPRRQR